MTRATRLAAFMWAAGALAALLAGSAVVQARAARAADEAIGLGPGYRPPPFTASDINGKPHRLSDYEGEVLVLHFWATWCPYCRSEIPELKELQSQWASKGVRVLAVSSDADEAKLRAFVSQQGLTYPVIADAAREASLSEQYAVQGIPVTYIIGRDGRIFTRLSGAGEILDAVQKALQSSRT
jgi:peroxiredoxin